MGKVLVIGKAERRVMPDCCDFVITVESRKNTSAAASKDANTQFEALLSKLQAVAFDLSKIEMIEDSVESRREYNSDKIVFESTKRIRIHIPAEQKFINVIQSVLEEGISGVTYRPNFLIAKEAVYRKQLLQEAVADSRAKAEFLAESVGSKIIGIDTANLSGVGDVYDLTEDEEMDEVCERERPIPCLNLEGGLRFSDNLKPQEIKIDAKVKIVWLLSSD